MEHVISFIPFVIIGVVFAALILLPILGVGALLHSANSSSSNRVAYLYCGILLTITIIPILSNRELAGFDVLTDGAVDNMEGMVWIGRLCNLFMVFIGLESIIRSVRGKGALAGGNSIVFFGFVGFVLTNYYVNGIFGTVHRFTHQPLYAFFAVYAASRLDSNLAERCLIVMRNALIGFSILSILIAIIKPSMVFQSNYPSGVISYRLWGLASHANSFGPMLVLTMCLIYARPLRIKNNNILCWLLMIFLLALSQSKTAIFSTSIALIIMALSKNRENIAKSVREGLYGKFGVIVVCIIGLSAIILLSQLIFDVNGIVSRYLSSKDGAEIASLTNRDIIWAFALHEFHISPYFGFGPGLFDEDYRKIIGIRAAIHAHNQFMQSLGSAGAVGVAGLVGYLFILTLSSWRASKSSSGLSLAILSILLIRGLTEIPLSVHNATNSEFLIHLTLIIVCACWQKQAINKAPQVNFSKNSYK